MKQIYIIQPYKVGSKNAMSTAVVIPHDVVKDYKIDVSSVLVLKTESDKKRITLETIDIGIAKQENLKPAGVSLPTFNQQVSTAQVR